MEQDTSVNGQIKTLKQILQQPLPGLKAQERMAARVVPMPLQVPANARSSAVLCLLFPKADELNLLLMKRREDRSAHSGQISFPGGRHEPFDKDLLTTALREAEEEVGIIPSQVEVLGSLTSLYIPVSNFNVFPYVGYVPEEPILHPSPDEVAYTLEISVNNLFHEARKTVTDVISPAVPDVIRQVKAYQLEDGTIIWGATAMILSELEVVLETIR